MSQVSFSDVESALAGDDAHDALMVSGVVLFAGRERSVFLADGKPSTQFQTLAFFANSLPRAVAGRAMLAVHRMTGRWLPRARIALPEAVRARVEGDFSAVALYCGSPGPLQKVTLYVPPRRQAIAGTIVKIALGPSADALVEREAASLTLLSRLPAVVSSHVPQLLCTGRLESGRNYFATSAATGAVAPAGLCGDQLGFLAALARITAAPQSWAGGPASTRTRTMISSLPARALPEGLRGELLNALDDADTQLGISRVPHVCSHGDFTRFNIRGGDERFTVFDWEFSSDRANPLADLLHYSLSQRTRRSPLALIRAALARAESHLSSMPWEYVATPRDVAALALHALVNTVAFYAASGSRLDMGSFIVDRYVRLIRARGQWGPV